MFKTNLIKIAPSFKWSLIDKVLTKSAEVTSHKLYIFSEDRINPDIISKIYQRRDSSNLFFLCCGLPLQDYTEIDDIDLFISPFVHDQERLTDLQSKLLHWKRTKFMHLSVSESDEESDEDKCDIGSLYNYGVLGGTFDDLHIGHKLLLTTASLICTDKLLIGLTHEDLLKKKKMVELLQSYAKREAHIINFLNIINPKIEVKVVPISDPIGPSGTDPDLDVLIVSKETEGGIKIINEARQDIGLNILDSHIVDLVFPSESTDKLSSSIRRRELLAELIESDTDVSPWLRRTTNTKTLKPHKLPYVIGLTGGICSGKSTISKYLKEKGIETIDCDKIGHQVYCPYEPAYNLVVDEFGKGIVDAQNFIDRKALGKIVFSDPSKMKRLNELVWPCIADAVNEQIKSSDSDVIVVEAAVLLEAGWQSFVDEVWVMTVSPNEAIKRLSQRNKLPVEDAEKRLSAQMNNVERCSHADIVICSDWEPAFTESLMDKAWSNFQQRVEYYKICQSSESIENRWNFIASKVCNSPKDQNWLETICRSEKSKSFLDIALTAVDETLDLSEDKYLILYTAFFFLSTTLHVQNSSARAYEAMFKMFYEGNDINKEVADEIMENIKIANNLQKKTVSCSEFNLLFRDIWMKAAIFCLDEGDQRILPSVVTIKEVTKEQKSVQCELLLRLSEGSKHIFKTEHFRKSSEIAAKKKINLQLEKLAQEDNGSIVSKVRNNIGYILQEQ